MGSNRVDLIIFYPHIARPLAASSTAITLVPDLFIHTDLIPHWEEMERKLFRAPNYNPRTFIPITITNGMVRKHATVVATTT